MAKFKIYSPAGTEIYEGTPSFTGQYMAPGLLEFRKIASPVPLDLVAGCYVDYTRTGFRYRIYGVPQVKKQARQRSYGGAFIYQNVQLYDASKMLEFCPFRDLVKGDNRIHFSTQPSISTFEGVDGLARRFEACLQDQYGANSWRVRVATTDDGISQDIADLMADAREFTVSGVNILECLNKVYEIWPEVGWVYTVEEGIDTIIIGGAGLNANQGTYAYGKGNGLTSLTRTVANADEMANRIYAYGSSRNMLPRWYNNQTIKDAESVDIQNLMIPVSSWGVTDGLPDASKAYVDDGASITKMGLRPATVYFDGSGEYPEIYPTIREATIGEVRAALGSSSAKYYPSTSIYTDTSARVDKILAVPTTFDSGLAGDTSGKTTIGTEYTDVDASQSVSFPAGIAHMPVYNYQGTYTPSASGTLSLTLDLNLSGAISLTGIKSVTVTATIRRQEYQGLVLLSGERTIDAVPGASSVQLVNMSFSSARVPVSTEDTYNVLISVAVDAELSDEERTCGVDISGGLSTSIANYRSKTFTIRLRQIGFDISEQAALGDGKTISMRSGSCVGRTFTINTVQYDSAGDAWVLECFRSEDESLSQWFPNTDYPVRAGDEFVLLDIAMPEIYIGIAEGRLLQAAQDLLSDTATERWQYIPEIDAKYMVENSRIVRAGEYMTLLDPEIIEEGTDGYVYFKTSNDEYLLTSNGEKIVVGGGMVTAILVDTVVINEGEAAIPTYKVTLRDRKRKTWTESESAPTSTSKSVGTVNEVSETTSSGSGSSFWTLDDNGNVTLKPQYENAWVPGWLAAGGIGTESSGGVSFLKELTDIYHNENGILRSDGTAVQNGDVLVYDSTNARWSAAAQSGGGGGSTVSWGEQSGNTIPLSVDGVSKTLLLSGALSGYATQSWVQNQGYLTSHQSLSGYATETWVGNNYLPLAGGQLTGDLRLKPSSSNYGSTLRFGDGDYAYIKENTDDHLYFYSGKGMDFVVSNGYDINLNGVSVSDIVTLSGNQTIQGAKTFSTNPVTIASDSGISVNAASYIDIGDARLEYDSGAKAIHVTYRSGSGQTIGLFADGFLAAGGVAGQSNVKFVTLDGDQIIEGEKTFTDYTEFSSSLQITGENITSGSLLYVNGLTTIAGNLSLTGTLNGISVSKDNYGYGDISIGSRLYIQTGSNDLLLGSGSGKVIVGGHPGGTAIGSNKFYVGGTAIATTWNTTSDRRLKDEISLLQKDEAIEKLMALAPSTWKWNSGSEKGKMASGFIAQEMEDVLPFMVSGGDYKGIAYQMLHAYEVSAIQSHEERIRVLEKENAMLRDMINTIRA